MRRCFGSNVVKFSLLFTRNYRKNRFLRWSMCPWDTLLTCYHLFLEDMTLHLNMIYLKIQLFSYGEKNTCVDITFAYTGIRKVGGEPSNFFFKYKLNAIKALKLKVVELDPYFPLSICFQWWCIQHQNYLNAERYLNYHLLTWELHETWIFHLSIDKKTKMDFDFL